MEMIYFLMLFNYLNLVWCHSNEEGEKEFVHHGTPSKTGDHFETETGEHDAIFAREALFGNEADEFAALSTENGKQKLREILIKMDRNDNGKIERLELKQWIVRTYSNMDKEDALKRSEECDSNKDNAITWSEHVECQFADLGDPSTKTQQEIDEDNRMMDEDKELFEAADANHDGILKSDTEFVDFVYPESNKKMQKAVVDQMLRKKDVNKDGKIDFQEFVGEEGKTRTSEWIEDEKRTFDDTLDGNGDGFLDDDEIVEWMIPSASDIAEDEVKHLMAGVDEDNDEKLTFDEIMNKYHLFVGSDATGDSNDHDEL